MQREEQIYDAWFIWNLTIGCNLKCLYCISKPRPKEEEIIHISHPSLKTVSSDLPRKILKISRMKIMDLMKVSYSMVFRGQEEIPKIDIPALMAAMDNTGRIFRLDFSGGEPFLIPNIIETCVEVAKKHYICVITNLTSRKVKEFCTIINPQRVATIIASLHFKELERFNLVQRYIDNFILCKEKGFAITAREVAYPPFVNQIGKYRVFFEKKGIEINYRPFCGKYNGKLYPQAYTQEELEVFGLTVSDQEMYLQKGKVCNAGYNAGVVLPNGDIRTCFRTNESIGNIYKSIHFRDKLIMCPFDYCECPLNAFGPYVFKKALEKNGKSANGQNQMHA